MNEQEIAEEPRVPQRPVADEQDWTRITFTFHADHGARLHRLLESWEVLGHAVCTDQLERTTKIEVWTRVKQIAALAQLKRIYDLDEEWRDILRYANEDDEVADPLGSRLDDVLDALVERTSGRKYHDFDATDQQILDFGEASARLLVEEFHRHKATALEIVAQCRAEVRLAKRL